MEYSANEIAKYVIYLFDKKQKSITNLKLQKILYYIQMASAKKYGKPAFLDEIQAWRHGPVIPNVYYEYNQFVAEPIKLCNSLGQAVVDEKSKAIIDEVVSKYEDTSAWTLVDYTHREDPWKKNYQPDTNSVISFEDIKAYAKKQ